MQQSQTAHLPLSPPIQASSFKPYWRWPLAFSLSASSASRTSARFITPLTMSATPMRFPVTDDRCRFSDLLCFRPRLRG
jgi:hypothetical protein